MATLYAKTAGGNWNSANTWSNVNAGGVDNSGPPTASDDVIFELASGNVTINAAAVCRSLDTTSGTGTFGGTITHNSGITLSIGTSTAGAGNVSIKLNSGMTYTLGNSSSSACSFLSSSATAQTVDFAGKACGNISFSAGPKVIVSGLSMSGGQLTHTSNTVQYDGASDNSGLLHTVSLYDSNNSNTRTMTLGNCTFTCTGSGNSWNVNGTNLTVNKGTSLIKISGSGAGFVGGGKSYYGVTLNASGNQLLSGPNTFVNFTRTGNASKTCALSLDPANTQSVSGILTLNGNSIENRLLILSATYGSQAPFTVTGATITASNVDFRDIRFQTGTTDLSAITGGSGNYGGNSGITFTTGTNKYWFKDTGNYSDSTKWFTATNGGGSGSQYPLPQDTAIFDANSFSTTTRVITQDVTRIGNVNWTGSTNTPTWSTNTVANEAYGSITLISGMTFTTGTTGTWTYMGRGSSNLTSAGKSFATSFTLNAPGGTLVLQDALLITGTSGTLGFNAGTFDGFTNNVNVTAFAYTDNFSSSTKVIKMGATWTVTRSSSGNGWNFSQGGTTWQPNSSTILLSDTGSNDKVFIGNNVTYNNITITGGGSGKWTIQGSNAFNVFTINAPKTVVFTAGTTTTVSSFVAIGSAGNLITISSSVAGTPATLTKSSGIVSCNYLSLSDITATGGATWYAGSNSTDQKTEMAQFKFNESSGTPLDTSGRGRTVTKNGTTVGVAGKLNNGISMNGTQSDNLVGADWFYSDVFSLSVWINITTLDANGRNIIAKRSTAGANNEYVLLYLNTGFQFVTWQSDVSTCVAINASTTVNTGTWYHLVAVQRGNGQTANLYLNNVSIGSATQSAVMQNTASTINFGTTTNSTDTRCFGGIMDEARFYNRALTLSEIATLYNSGNGTETLLTLSSNTGWIFDGAHYTEPLSITIVDVMSEADLQTYKENLTNTGVFTLSGTDKETYLESRTITIVSTLSRTDLQTYLESRNLTIVSNITDTDVQTYLETLNMSIISTLALTDIQTYLENLSMTVVASLTETDLKAYRDDLALAIVSSVSEEDFQTYSDAVSFIISSDMTITDQQAYIDNLLIEIDCLISLAENYHFILTNFKPVSIRIERNKVLSVFRDRIVKISTKKPELSKISVRRKNW